MQADGLIEIRNYTQFSIFFPVVAISSNLSTYFYTAKQQKKMGIGKFLGKYIVRLEVRSWKSEATLLPASDFRLPTSLSFSELPEDLFKIIFLFLHR